MDGGIELRIPSSARDDKSLSLGGRGLHRRILQSSLEDGQVQARLHEEIEGVDLAQSLFYMGGLTFL